jgi:hypothetical protein
MDKLAKIALIKSVILVILKLYDLGFVTEDDVAQAITDSIVKAVEEAQTKN